MVDDSPSPRESIVQKRKATEETIAAYGRGDAEYESGENELKALYDRRVAMSSGHATQIQSKA